MNEGSINLQLVHSQGHRVYYHRIVVEKEMQQENKEVIIVKCGWVPHQQQQQQSNTTGLRAKRADELSPDFVEDEYVYK